ncbi:MAG: cell division protein FtsQ/DivIB [Anaerolineae bacterium]
MRIVPSKRRPRRSRSRLGRDYQATAPAIKLSLRPVVSFWEDHGGKALGFFLLLALGGLTYQLFAAEAFYVYEASVAGNRLVPAEAVYQNSGLEGMSIFWINPAQVEAAIVSLPNIKEARVRCGLPDRVTIEVVERQPQVIWQQGEKRYWIDEEGTVLPALGELAEATVIVDLDERPVQPGDRVDPQVIAGAQKLRSLLPELSTVQYASHTGLSFQSEQGWPIYLGQGEDIEQKVAIMKALLQEIAAKGVHPQFIDLRFKGRPYYK